MKSLNKNNVIITILGPTASGKTLVAANLAKKIKGEIISADSRQVYKKMNLGTGKDYGDYVVNGHKIRYHLVDIKEPGYKYNLFEFQQDFYRAYVDIVDRNKVPILCGGTGLYIESATKVYNILAVPPSFELRRELETKSMEELTEILLKYRKMHNTTDVDTKKRAIRAIEIEKYKKDNDVKVIYPSLKPIYFGIKFDRGTQRARITKRLEDRLQNGMIDEVQGLLSDGVSHDDLIYYGLEYKYIVQYLKGAFTKEEMFTKLNTAIHQFAKRQMTWFRRMERNGDKIHWFDGYEPMEGKVKGMMEIILKENIAN